MKIDETLNKLLRVINIHLTEKGYPPTVREMADEMGVSSTSTVQYYLKLLEEQGKIKRGGNKNRAIEVIKELSTVIDDNSIKVPLVGTVAAGTPILAVENYEDQLTLPKHFFKGGEQLFMLNVKGDSMIEAGIYNGDYVIVKKQNYADNSDIVVAMLNGSATVKRFFKEENHIRLQPENSSMQPIYCFDVDILGKVVGVIRKY